MIYDRAKHVKLITLRLLPQNDSTMLEILSSPIQHTTHNSLHTDDDDVTTVELWVH